VWSNDYKKVARAVWNASVARMYRYPREEIDILEKEVAKVLKSTVWKPRKKIKKKLKARAKA